MSGYSNSGEVLAIMGSSGSGKTTLVSILAGQNNRVLNGHISGEITANGKNIRETSYQLHCAYVTQEDILLATLTARESLMFSSQLRCSGALEDHKNRVEKILEDLKLDMIGDDLIGSVFNKGVSGGERKRICIGIELITEPSILILDEPTSGLDSYTADIVFRLLQDQARKGRNIITTVHQPSYAIFEKISRLILMSEGNIIYQGPAHRSRKFFADLDYKCPRNVLPTDYYMKILHVVNRHDQTEVEKNNLERFLIAYKSLNVIEDKPKPDFPSYDTDLSDKPYVASFLSRFSILLSRSSKNARRNVFFSRVKIAQAIGVALLLTLIFNNLGKDYAAIQNRNGVLYMLALTAFTLGSANASLSFPIERPLIMKEFSQGLYDSYSYFIAKTITEIPNLCVAIMLESLIVY